jgi:hypothetical protein
MTEFPAFDRTQRIYCLAASAGLEAVGLALLGLLVATGRL